MKPITNQPTSSIFKLAFVFVSLTMLCVALSTTLVSAQNAQVDKYLKLRGHVAHAVSQVVSDLPTHTSAPRGYAHYTAKDWRKLVDSVWGPGLPTDQKLQIFDGFWNNVNQQYVGFPGLGINWDSIRSVFRPEIAQGVSRGRFAGIMSVLYLSLRCTHTSIYDKGIDSTFYIAGNYRPRGVPSMMLSGWGWTGMGATLTPLPDSSLLVISAASNQPFGLKPGDVVLGYDRVPWRQLARQLLDAQLPVVPTETYWGSSPESWTHNLLTSAAINWYLFDSLDVVKYATGDTVHFATSRLDNTDWDNFFSVDQLPIKGVQIVDFTSGPQCTWGIVDGTNVGYMYIEDWSSATAALVSSAVDDFMRVKKPDGLIIDTRVNGGGTATLFTALGGLFNNDPFRWWSNATRTSTTDKLGCTINSIPYTIAPKLQFYDRPIAVLTGTECWSAGDMCAFLMRSHPMVRFFGKGTNTAYASAAVSGNYWGNLWFYGINTSQTYSNYPGEGYLIHTGFDIDEKVWFTKDDVAKGDDTVVKRALQWIAGLAYGHGVALATMIPKPGQDTVKIKATVENPQKHALSVWSFVTDKAGTLVDSCQMFDDGLHNDGMATDKVYGGKIPPQREGAFGLSLRTVDVTGGTYRRLAYAQRFWTNGPIVSKGWRSTTADTIPNPGDVLRLKFLVANNGKSDSVTAVTATVTPLDTMVYVGTVVQLSYGDLAPGQQSEGTAVQNMKIQSYCPPNTKVRLLLTISTDGFPVWTDTVSIMVQAAATAVEQENTLPREYSLRQNYPNPFNPSTTIEYDLPKSANLSLRIYNTLGQVVATLVDEKKEAGYYTVRWNANIPSGIYFYRLQAGDASTGAAREFVETKKMIVLK